MILVPCEETMKKVEAKRVNRFDESIDIYTEFFKPYEITSFDDTFCIAMTNSARYNWNNTMLKLVAPCAMQLSLTHIKLPLQRRVTILFCFLCS